MKLSVERKIAAGFALPLILLVMVGVVSYRNTRELVRDSNLVAHAHDLLDELGGMLSTMKDAETGQRGYIITGDEAYLEPYSLATAQINQNLARLRQLIADDAAQQQRLSLLEREVQERLALISASIELRRTKGFEAAARLIATGRGKMLMDDIRRLVAEMMRQEEATLAAHRLGANSNLRNTAITLSILGLILLGFLPASYFVIRRDLGKRRRAEQSLRESEERYKYLIEQAKEIIYQTDLDGHLVFVNPTGYRTLKFSEEELRGRHYLELVKPEFRAGAEKFYGRQFVKKIPNTYYEFPVTTKDGAEIWLGQNTQLIMSEGRIIGFQAVARDVTERKRALEELHSLSLKDDLTGLYNRRGFLTLAEQLLKQAQRNKQHALLVFADLDGLKQINDRFGHQEGSNVIIKTAEVLKQTFRESDIIARLGGDEFTVLAVIPSGESSVLQIRSRLQEKIRAYNARRAHPYELSVSVGIELLEPDSKLSIDEMIRIADAAMYEHKHAKAGRR
ncbi:MAG TPA: CHASE3 domain-containing protein [Pyrinomonadaceae bacterium]|jgi:diguanylate cyclase (GGDEF)-like protein/PAS domain S-box-containing protein